MTFFLYFINSFDLYNYANDHTFSFHSPDFAENLKVLPSEGKILIYLFCFNCMQANPNEFQAIAVGKTTHEKSPTFYFGSNNITCDEMSNYWVPILILNRVLTIT